MNVRVEKLKGKKFWSYRISNTWYAARLKILFHQSFFKFVINTHSSLVKPPFNDLFRYSKIFSNTKLSGQIVIAGNGTSLIGIVYSARLTTISSDRNFLAEEKINKNKMAAETALEQPQNVLKRIIEACYELIQRLLTVPCEMTSAEMDYLIKNGVSGKKLLGDPFLKLDVNDVYKARKCQWRCLEHSKLNLKLYKHANILF